MNIATLAATVVSNEEEKYKQEEAQRLAEESTDCERALAKQLQEEEEAC